MSQLTDQSLAMAGQLRLACLPGMARGCGEMQSIRNPVMLRSMLVGLDGSNSSAAAGEVAIGWAQRFGARLAGLAIVDEPAICRPEPTGIWGGAFKKHRDADRLAHARSQVKGFLEQFARRCSRAGVACQLLENVGCPYDQILQEGQRFDLILLGKQPRFHFETQENDSDTLPNVIRGGSRPVVVVPDQVPEGRTVLVAYDSSPPAARALQAFQASGLAEGKEVSVVCVDADKAVAQRNVERAVGFLRLHEIEAKACPVVTSTAPARVLLERARQLGAGLLVMGAYGRSRLREYLFGSLTRTLLREVSVPLFVSH